MKGALLSIFALVAGGFLFYELIESSNGFMKHIVDTCTEHTPTVTGVYPLDCFLCTIIPFFQEVTASPEGLFVTSAIFWSLSPFTLFVLLESGRYGSKGFIRYPTLFLSLSQILGIGFCTNFFYFPSYVYSQSKAPKTARAVSLNRIYLALFLLLVMMPLNFLTLQLPSNTKTFKDINLLFQFFPVIMIFLSLFPEPDDNRKYVESSRLAQFGYTFIAGISFCGYYAAFFNLLLSTGLIPFEITNWDDYISSLQSLIFTLDFSNGCVQFLFFDLLGVWFSVFLIALYEDSFLGIISFLFQSVFLSPGYALSMFFWRREERLSSLPPTPIQGKKQKKHD